MKTLRNISCILATVVALASCQEAALEDFNLQAGKSIQVETGNIAGEISKTNEFMTIPVSLKLSGNATKAFEVTLSINQDTLEKMAVEGKLDNTIVISSSALQIDNVAKVDFGSDVAQFKITVARTEVERHFGKQIAIGYSLDDAGKNNVVNQEQKIGVIILNTNDFLTPEDIHYISFQTGGDIIQARDRQNYNSSSGGISIPLTLNLASFPGNPFTVDIVTDSDTITDMVAEGILPPTTVALQEDDFSTSTKVGFKSNASEASFSLDIPWSVINNNLGKHLAIVVRLKNPSLHILNEEKSFTTILIDCDNVLEEDVTHLGVFSVNRDNGNGPDGGEGSKKLVDNNIRTKFLQADFIGDLECKLVFDEPQKIGAYTLTSANDAQGRDPKDWQLQGSNDGINWTTIDRREGESFSGREMTRRFNISYPVSYTHYRLNITAIVGGTNLFQLAEWRMIKVR